MDFFKEIEKETENWKRSHPMMKCGHAASASNKDGKPACVICIGLHPGAEVVDDNPPSLKGRMAKCGYQKTCKNEQPSDPNLAFFESQPDKDYDLYYCGCHGWD